MNNTIVTPGVGTIKPDAELNVMKEEITRELTNENHSILEESS